MPLIKCSDQKQQTLEEFYTWLVPDKITTFADLGTPMLKVLKLLNETFKDTVIYGLTSHSSLILLSKDTYRSPWYVAINGLDTEYYIEYLIPENKQPWPNAYVKGSTTSLDELKKYIIIAMTESKGWEDSNELKKMYLDQKL